MGAGKNKVRRKKRISKHVQDAEERRRNKAQQDGGEADDSTEPKSTEKKTETAKSNRHIKDPSQAGAYLSSWKHREAGSGWKFNKNTQSWLIRHMYETDKVPKATFTMLVEYLLGVKGITRTRLREEAARRALRYKEFEKRAKAEGHGEDGGQAKDSIEAGSGHDKKKSDDAEIDVARWNALDDHDKRKEYKRARKILDSIKEEQEKSSE
mmetsp:Transcript_21422/g.46709  ORF Transcript_21422/g.46709 Transcript_21422/m.46709 type:complete len:210 (+) Transcript_21422:112-741(+)|eukprot:CAMPEP_0178706646 /NCGR_PEP_ID=MMETSP0699-20121125/15535_1 /TAXON_ID=265572 /ORGANISM="Extubocellulus spinifer, Strain CCMP396" /LENGTH=209 /DNA_ID=CAMNT_0020354495 /DNA_START=265 /DNA_END=894 /DNA_ORIENTATION=+